MRNVRSIMVTGGLGFLGFSFIRHVRRRLPECRVSCMDGMARTPPFFEEKLKWLEENGVQVYKYMTYDPNLEYPLMIEKADAIVNFAAETPYGCQGDTPVPGQFVTANVVGAYNLLEFCRRMGIWLHQVGDAEAYGPSWPAGPRQLSPATVFASTKASADLIALSYAREYKVGVTVTRCGACFGPFQQPDAPLPRMVAKALSGKPIALQNSGATVRQWTHADAHSEAVLQALLSGKSGEAYDVPAPAGCSMPDASVARLVLARLGLPEERVRLTGRRQREEAQPPQRAQEGQEEGQRRLAADLEATVDWISERARKG